MRRWVVAVCVLCGGEASAQQSVPTTVPTIAFDSVPDVLKLPPNLYLGEVTGVANQLQEAPLRAVSWQYHGASLCRGGSTIAGVRSQREVRPRDRQEPLCLVVRAFSADRQGRQHLGR